MPFEGFDFKRQAEQPPATADSELTPEEHEMVRRALVEAPHVPQAEDVPVLAKDENLHPVKPVEDATAARDSVSNPHGFTELR
ncbi:MAG TPA: hypothetical protein VKP88_04480 [Candidatus Paceibacterota bacterium]|nr:hypothetical protein [Candidatus Paceibacterota bacterium]